MLSTKNARISSMPWMRPHAGSMYTASSVKNAARSIQVASPASMLAAERDVGVDGGADLSGGVRHPRMLARGDRSARHARGRRSLAALLVRADAARVGGGVAGGRQLADGGLRAADVVERADVGDPEAGLSDE